MKTRLLACGLALAIAGCGDRDRNTTSTGKVIHVAEEDAGMNAAMEAARESFGSAWERIRGDRKRAAPRFATAMVKARFVDANDPEGEEHLWIDDIHYDGETIRGIVASEPLHLAQPKLRDEVSFPLDRLSDWLVVHDGVAEGGYTVQLLRKRMSAAERKEHDSHYPFRFPEP